MSKLVIIDGHAIIHRAYHSIPPLTVNGQPVNALYGFYSMLLTVLNNLRPEYLIVCLDSPGPNFRNEEFLGYRAKRKPTDHTLVVQLPQLKKTLESANISTFSMGGYEADDLIATITQKALKKIQKNTRKKIIDEIFIITGDKDLMQLVSNKVKLFVPVRGLSETKIFTPKDVFEKLGVKPQQVVDLKALMGDMSDNYPGVAGIGPKAATSLLYQYQTLDNIYSHLDEIKDSTKEKLVNDKDSAYLSQKLAILVSNIPIKLKLSQAKWGSDRIKDLTILFKNYNFKSLIQRLEKQSSEFIKKNNSSQTSLF